MKHRAILRQRLRALRAIVVEVHGEDLYAEEMAAALAGSDEQLKAYLVSNNLWGGAGSLADQGGFRITAALADLGRAQLGAGVTNPRVKSWVEANDAFDPSEPRED